MSGKKIPFSEIAHIDALTMAYVLSLREQPPDDDFTKNMSEEDKKILDAENKPMRKGQVACKVKNCKDITIAISMAVLDGVHTKKDIKKNQEILEETDQRILDCNEEMSYLDEVYDGIQLEYASLNSALATKEKHLKSVNFTKFQLENLIKKATRSLEKLKQAAREESSNVSLCSISSADMLLKQDEEVQTKTIVEDSSSSSKKHSGVFNFDTNTRIFCWSCCLSDQRAGPGCMDDQVISF